MTIEDRVEGLGEGFKLWVKEQHLTSWKNLSDTTLLEAVEQYKALVKAEEDFHKATKTWVETLNGRAT